MEEEKAELNSSHFGGPATLALRLLGRRLCVLPFRSSLPLSVTRISLVNFIDTLIE